MKIGIWRFGDVLMPNTRFPGLLVPKLINYSWFKKFQKKSSFTLINWLCTKHQWQRTIFHRFHVLWLCTTLIWFQVIFSTFAVIFAFLPLKYDRMSRFITLLSQRMHRKRSKYPIFRDKRTLFEVFVSWQVPKIGVIAIFLSFRQFWWVLWGPLAPWEILHSIWNSQNG